MKKIVNSQKDQKKGSLTLTLRKSQGSGKEDGTPHVKQGEDLFWALTTHNSPVTTFSIYYVLGQGSLFLRLSERSKAKALLVPCSASISDIQLSQWIMRQYIGIPATASQRSENLPRLSPMLEMKLGIPRRRATSHTGLYKRPPACQPVW